MTDRDLLEKLYGFMTERNFVLGNEASVRDMVNRYAQPPLTMRSRVAMQLTVPEYKVLGELLTEIRQHLTDAAEGEHLGAS